MKKLLALIFSLAVAGVSADSGMGRITSSRTGGPSVPSSISCDGTGTLELDTDLTIWNCLADDISFGGVVVHKASVTIQGADFEIRNLTPLATLVDTDGAGAAARGSISLLDSAQATRWRIGSIADGDLGVRGNAAALVLGDSSGANVIRIVGGNVGIGGLTTPDGSLHIQSGNAGVVTADSTADDLVVENNMTAGISILGTDSVTNRLVFGSPSDAFGAIVEWSHDADLMRVGSQNAGASLALGSANGVEAIRIDANQNVGIGTISPAAKLHISSSTVIIDGIGAGILIANDSGSITFERVTSPAPIAKIRWDNVMTTFHIETNNKDIKFCTQAFGECPELFIDQAAGGFIGINEAAPAARLEVKSAEADLFTLQVSSQNGVIQFSVDRLGKVRGESTINAAQNFVAGSGLVVSTLTATQLQMNTANTGDSISLRLNKRSGYAAGGSNWIQMTQGPDSAAQNLRFGFDFDSQSFQIRGGSPEKPVFEMGVSGDLQIGAPGSVSTFTAAGSLVLTPDAEITIGTIDGSDDGMICIGAGSACGSSRGANVVLHGNEDTAGTEGRLTLQAGNDAGDGSIRLQTGGTSDRVVVLFSGNVNFGPGITNDTFLHADIGTGFGGLKLDGSSGACIMMRDTDDAGWTEVTALNGVLTASTDADGVCDGA